MHGPGSSGQHPVEVPGVSDVELLRTAATARCAVRRPAELSKRSRPPWASWRSIGLVSEASTRAFGRREEAPRDPAAEPAQAQDRDPGRDRLGPGCRRAAGGQRGRQPICGGGARRRPAHHALHPDPALHPAAVRARVRRWPHRRVGRPGTGRRTRENGYMRFTQAAAGA